tara:strand:- start:408 stop:755 length:348 start_codon:yes stop_codon:yes gene_type:complete
MKKKTKIFKPWGYEELISVNKEYVLKKLFMKKGHRCSLQFHKKKHETIFVLSGKLKILYGKNTKKLKSILLGPNKSIILKPFIIHRMEGLKNTIYLEASTNHLKDVVRLSDDYGR